MKEKIEFSVAVFNPVDGCELYVTPTECRLSECRNILDLAKWFVDHIVRTRKSSPGMYTFPGTDTDLGLWTMEICSIDSNSIKTVYLEDSTFEDIIRYHMQDAEYRATRSNTQRIIDANVYHNPITFDEYYQTLQQ